MKYLLGSILLLRALYVSAVSPSLMPALLFAIPAVSPTKLLTSGEGIPWLVLGILSDGSRSLGGNTITSCGINAHTHTHADTYTLFICMHVYTEFRVLIYIK